MVGQSAPGRRSATGGSSRSGSQVTPAATVATTANAAPRRPPAGPERPSVGPGSRCRAGRRRIGAASAMRSSSRRSSSVLMTHPRSARPAREPASAAGARAWRWIDLTVPEPMPSAAAVCTSVRSSKNRRTRTVRCRVVSRARACSRVSRRSLSDEADEADGCVVRAERALLEPSRPPPRDVLGVEDAAHVRLGVTLDPVPRLGRLEQRCLHEVLREVGVPGEEVRRARQGRRAGVHELAELLLRGAVRHVDPLSPAPTRERGGSGVSARENLSGRAGPAARRP